MIKLLLADLKMLLRNRQALFWNLAFPLMFTVIFGFFFSGGNPGGGTTALVNGSNTFLAKKLEDTFRATKLVTIKSEPSLEAAKAMLKRNQVQAVVYVPPGFGSEEPGAPTTVSVFCDPGNLQSNAMVTGFLEKFLTEVNYRVQQVQPIFRVDQQRISTNRYGYFDFVLIGLIGMALMNSSIQALAISMSIYREDKILKRITTTPLPTWEFITAEVLSRLVINAVQVAVILSVGVYCFHGRIYGSVPILFALSLLGAILFQLVGFFIASVAKSTPAAEGMSTAVAIPMMFLAGVFFPIDQSPRWLLAVIRYLPLAPLLRMLRGVALESQSPFENPANIAIILGWIAVMLALTIYRFRLNSE